MAKSTRSAKSERVPGKCTRMGGCGPYVFDQGALVLEGVTLAEMVEFVVEMLVNLAGGTVFDQKTAENS
jgi:hypothetical protein